MTFLECCKTAGRFGVIARGAWSTNNVVLVCEVEKIGGKMRFVLLEANGDSLGNFTPAEADLAAKDWAVVSKSTRRFEKGL